MDSPLHSPPLYFPSRWDSSGRRGRRRRHVSAHLLNIHEPSAPACPYAMTPRDNCGSRLLQPLVSVTKIGTQVSCHSKSLFFHFPINQSIWAARDYGPGGRASARTAQGDGAVFGREAAAATAPGRINQKRMWIQGRWWWGGGVRNMSAAFWGQRVWWNSERRESELGPTLRGGRADTA